MPTLVGALVGVLTTGLVGWFGPLRLQRRQAESTAGLQEQLRLHELRLEETRTRNALELQRLQNAHERELEAVRAAQARVDRIVCLRLVGSAWMQAILTTLDRLEAGEQKEPGAFDEEFVTLRREADEAAARLMLDGVWVSSADDEHGMTAPLFAAMARATEALRAVVVAAARTGVVADPVPAEVREAVRGAEVARERFRTTLFELLAAEGALRRV
ncbi:hypothetical protein [Streptomyces xantholiticus]|uniref:hypothetical protein n=1 Tax=Streptomyces xantholiticus TaxID=68285 RepID=UPI001988D067|nr:hypothetical protein [Streptomyces xantholiticus]GGW73744.1 hypothetical protein GCM10010381_68090 [Streptomyces xantholiticus]